MSVGDKPLGFGGIHRGRVCRRLRRIRELRKDSVVGYALHSIFLQNLGSVNGRKRGQTRDSRTSNKEAVYAKMR